MTESSRTYKCCCGKGFNKVHYYTYSVLLSVFAFLYVGIDGRRFLFCHGPLYSIDLFRYLGGHGGGNLMFNGRGVWRLAYAMVRINIKLPVNQVINQWVDSDMFPNPNVVDIPGDVGEKARVAYWRVIDHDRGTQPNRE